MAEARTLSPMMTPELWEKLKEPFRQALELPEDEHARFISEICGSDQEMKLALAALLKSHRATTRIDDAPIIDLKAVFHGEHLPLAAGTLILGRFEVVRPLGAGGMGEVYEAIDHEMGQIALKIIRPEIASNPEIVLRFKQEVQLARKLSGPHICRVHEFFVMAAENGTSKNAFLTMELLNGKTLSDTIQENGPLPWRDAKRIAIEICAGLQMIHEAGIIHRDLKSRNIMLATRNGSPRAVLMDFGLAREFSTPISDTDPGLTRPGAIVGTPDNMAPEQFEGKTLTAATDIYALGVVLYELVTGKHPFDAPNPIGAAVQRGRRLRSPSSIQRGLPRSWDSVISKCMAYEPEQRYQSAKAVADALRSKPLSVESFRRNRSKVLWAAAILLLATATSLTISSWRSMKYYRPSTESRRWYDLGVAALREGNYVRATRSLSKAITEDEQFAMAHARLAEAWSNLDFDGSAQQEMLIASSSENHLPPLDRMYLDAIRDTLTHNYPGALTTYKRILDQLPDGQRSAGYVDLGMAYKRAGDPNKALESYAQASRLDSNNTAAYMQNAVLQSHLHHPLEAEKAFDHVHTIFSAEMNPEGLAELDYERGYTANLYGNNTEAQHFLTRSLDEAKQLPSVQLEIRALTQLSSVSYSSARVAEAEEFAQLAIELARQNRLDAWAADGLARLGFAQLVGGRQKAAESSFNEALKIAQQSQQQRVETLANLGLASVFDQEGRPDEVIAPAEAALKYSGQNGYFESDTKADLLLSRAQQAKGHLQEASESANQLLKLASQAGDRESSMQAEEQVGSVLVALERYPEALEHFQKARSFADNRDSASYQILDCADALQRLGRYAEADALIPLLSPGEPFATGITGYRVSTLLSQQHYQQALTLATRTIAARPALDSDVRQELEIDQVIAQAHLGKRELALSLLEHIQSTNRQSTDPGYLPRLELAAAEVYLFAGEYSKAKEQAASAQQYFTDNRLEDSELRSTWIAAAACKALHNVADDHYMSERSVDILRNLQQTWDSQSLQAYLARPDIRELATMSEHPQHS